MKIWDTAGQERFRSIAKSTIKGADGVILVFALNDKPSFKSIREWLKNIKNNLDLNKAVVVILGNKCELPDNEKLVTESELESFEENVQIKTLIGSAKNNINVQETFTYLVDEMMKKGLGCKKRSGEEYDINENNQSISLNPEKIHKSKQKGGCCKKGKNQ